MIGLVSVDIAGNTVYCIRPFQRGIRFLHGAYEMSVKKESKALKTPAKKSEKVVGPKVGISAAKDNAEKKPKKVAGKKAVKSADKKKSTIAEDISRIQEVAKKSARQGKSKKRTSAKKESKIVRTDSSVSAAEAARERAMTLAKKRAKRSQRKAVAKNRVTSSSPLNDMEIAEFREMLIAMRMRITLQIKILRNESLTRDDEVNPEEDGTDAFERLFALERAGSEQDMVFEIDEALRRIESGVYGACELCEGMIERARLKALPFVKNCIACQSELEGGTPRSSVKVGS